LQEIQEARRQITGASLLSGKDSAGFALCQDRLLDSLSRVFKTTESVILECFEKVLKIELLDSIFKFLKRKSRRKALGNRARAESKGEKIQGRAGEKKIALKRRKSLPDGIERTTIPQLSQGDFPPK
jgi:hypothetical protein